MIESEGAACKAAHLEGQEQLGLRGRERGEHRQRCGGRRGLHAAAGEGGAGLEERRPGREVGHLRAVLASATDPPPPPP